MRSPWRFVLVGIWMFGAGSILFALGRSGMPVIGLISLFLFFYLFTGFELYFMVVDSVKGSYAWRMILAWMPGLLSERGRAWVVPDDAWRT